MTIIERVRNLELPLDQLVVICGGVLDALNLRKAGDVDLVLSPGLFSELSQSPEWHLSTKHDEPILTRDDVEMFLSWGSEGVPNFTELYTDGMTVDGVKFADPQFVIACKRQVLREKDKADILLLEEYLHREK